ncbi:MAG TPA: alanyl-tRNA editing protein [Anaerolineae bacterium]
MHTEKLYYEDAYLREFTARVVAGKALAGHPAVALDRTAFYPTGGGQPNDRGTIGGIAVEDVVADDGLVWHVLAGDLAADSGVAVAGVVDWSRRFDHMQQHTGQHILSEAFIRERNARTVAFHLGVDACTIDLDRTDLGADDLAAVEAAANTVIDEALAVDARFITDAELARLPLRKAPSVEGPVRIVEIAGYDWSPCGGTHVANSAQVGLIKIITTERRGPELRITFLCGGRARADYANLRALADGLGARFTTGQKELLEAVDRLIAESRATRKDLGDLEAQWVEAQAAALAAAAPELGGWRVVCQAVDYPVERSKRLAQALRSRTGVVALLGVRGERPQLLFARADDVHLDISKVLRTAAATAGGRGGGRPEFAQGGAPDNEALERVLAAAQAELKG